MIPEKVRAKFRAEECPVIGLDGDCLNYYGRTNANGYATAYIDGFSRLLHRWMWETFRGDIPDKLVLDHLCRIRRCCNPRHLEPVTREENLRRVTNPVHRSKTLDESESWQRFTATVDGIVAGRSSS